MAIIDPGAISYCNEVVRPLANNLARSYYRLKTLNQQWVALPGTNAAKLALLRSTVNAACDDITDAYFQAYRAQCQWEGLGMNSLFINDPSEQVYDDGAFSGQDQSRPPVNGQDIQRLNTRWREIIAWLERGEFVATSVATLDRANLQQALKFTRDGARVPSGGQAASVATTFATAYINFLETNANQYLRHILVVAPNPNIGG